MDKNLRTRLLWLFGLIFLYKLGTHIPTPGVDGQALSEFFSEKGAGTIFGLLNMFTGGALGQMAVFGLGIGPYISASIIMNLASIMFPTLERLKQEGESGRKQITQYTRYLTLVIAIVQGFIFASSMVGVTSPSGAPVVADGGWSFKLTATLILTTGALFVMWLGEQITDKGIGNGSSLIIFVGIASSIIPGMGTLKMSVENEQLTFGALLFLAVIMVVVIAAIVAIEQGQRRVTIQYAKRQVGRKIYGGVESHLPLKINMAGVLPPIFASTLLFFPTTFLSFFGTQAWAQKAQTWFQMDGYLFNILYVVLIVFFAFFYTAIQTNPNDMAENLRKANAYVPGIRPGKHTADFFNDIITKLTFFGAIYLSIICVMPTAITSQFKISLYLGGTSLLILVGVALDTMSQIQSHLLNQNYEGFLKQARLRGRRG